MLNTCQKIWELLTPAEQRKSIWILLLISLMALLQTAGVLSIAPFLAVLARPAVIHEYTWLSSIYAKYEFAGPVTFISALGLITMIAVVASSIFKAITLHVVSWFINMQRQSLGVRLLSRYLQQPYEFFLTRNPSELTKNVLSEVDQLIFDLLHPLSIVVAQGAVALAMILLILFYDPYMALWIVGVVGALYGIIYFSVRKRLTLVGSAQQLANTRRYQTCHEVISGIKDVKITQATDTYLGEFSEASRDFSRRSASQDTLSQSPLYIVEAVGYTGLIALAIALLWRSGDASQVLPTIGLYGFAAYRLLPAMQSIYSGLTRLKFSGPVLEHIHRDLSMPSSQKEFDGPAIAPQHEIRLQGAFYAYPSAPDKPVLNNSNITISARKITGISGRSGVGKSTVMDILLGLLQPQAGGLYIDNVEITRHNVSAWQRSIGYVPQHIYLADTSIAENIAFGVAKDLIDMQAVERAARAAHIHDFIVNELPDGYLALIGDRGIRLSGGQRQRVGIARALYRDPPVLCMDEATSALDAQTEDAVNKAIRSLSGSKTVIIIAHRKSTLESCEKILEMT